MDDGQEQSITTVTAQGFVSVLPQITEEGVRAALDALLYHAGARPECTLQQLRLVDQILAGPTAPFGSSMREFALNRILTSIIMSELAELRSLFVRTPLEQENSMETIQQAFAADFPTANPELKAWSWLYYHYVRFDLNLSPTVFSSIVHGDERSLRRYQQHGIRRLTQRLIKREWAARRQYRRASPDSSTTLSLIDSPHGLRPAVRCLPDRRSRIPRVDGWDHTHGH